MANHGNKSHWYYDDRVIGLALYNCLAFKTKVMFFALKILSFKLNVLAPIVINFSNIIQKTGM